MITKPIRVILHLVDIIGDTGCLFQLCGYSSILIREMRFCEKLHFEDNSIIGAVDWNEF